MRTFFGGASAAATGVLLIVVVVVVVVLALGAARKQCQRSDVSWSVAAPPPHPLSCINPNDQNISRYALNCYEFLQT